MKFGPLSIGAAGNFINSEISETQAHDISNQVDSTGEYNAALNVQGNNGSFSAGVMLEVVPEHLWLAGFEVREFRVLWLGDPRVLPGNGWEASPGQDRRLW